MYVVAGTANPRLAKDVASGLEAELVTPDVRSFPDGEVYARVAEQGLHGHDVVVVQTTLGNDQLMELLLLLDAVKAQGARRVCAAIPYYAYSRQDQRFMAGEALSARVVAKAVAMDGDALVTVDPHKDHILDFFPGVAVGATAVPELAAHFADAGVDLVLAPDKGARERAQQVAEIMGVPFDHLEKTRLSGEEVVMKTKEMDVDGRTVAIIDDIISTGGTMAKATEQLQAQGASAVLCAASHGLFTGGAVERLTRSGVREVVATDTIEGPQSIVSAAPAVVRGVREAFRVETVEA